MVAANLLGLLLACYALSRMERDVLPVICMHPAGKGHTSGGLTHLVLGLPVLALLRATFTVSGPLADWLANKRWFRFDLGLGHLSSVSWFLGAGYSSSDSHAWQRLSRCAPLFLLLG